MYKCLIMFLLAAGQGLAQRMGGKTEETVEESNEGVGEESVGGVKLGGRRRDGLLRPS